MAEKKMDVYVSWDQEAEGITGRSLQMLRGALVECYNHPAAVVRVQTSDITCGFLVVFRRHDVHSRAVLNPVPGHEQYEATWSGDGFRTDGGGEGGAGMATAEALLQIFGFSGRYVEGAPWLYEHKTIAGLGELAEMKFQALYSMAVEAIGRLGDRDFIIPKFSKPIYLR